MREIAAPKDIERAVYLDSIVDVTMYGCNLEHKIMGQPITSTIKPVQDLQELGFIPCSVLHSLAKAAST